MIDLLLMKMFFLNEFFITYTAIIKSPTVSEKLNFTVQ